MADTSLTPEEIAAREIAIHRTPDHDCKAPVAHAIVATLDAARAAAPDGLREALERVESEHRRGDWTEDGFIGNSVDGRECVICGRGWPCPAQALRAAIAQSAPEAAEAAADEVERLAEALRDEQRYSQNLSFALIEAGHHAAAKHQGPQDYDGDSGMACAISRCLDEWAAGVRLSEPAAPEPCREHAWVDGWQCAECRTFERDPEGGLRSTLTAAPEPLDVEALRERVWKAQHDTTCDDGEPHEWTAHLPWDDDDARESAEREADAIVAALTTPTEPDAPGDES